jgi:hypothetical protein
MIQDAIPKKKLTNRSVIVQVVQALPHYRPEAERLFLHSPVDLYMPEAFN